MTESNYFNELNSIPCDIDKKMGLTYVTWAEAWTQLKKVQPDANYRVHVNEHSMPYFADETGAFVRVTVTVKEIAHEVFLPVMDNRNQSVKSDKLTSVIVNKNIQRALAKAIALHGIGLFAYRGEDLPEDSQEVEEVDLRKHLPKEVGEELNKVSTESVPKPSTFGDDVVVPCICAECQTPVTAKVRDYSISKYDKVLCYDCQKTKKN